MHTHRFAADRHGLLGTWSAVIAVGMAIVFAVQAVGAAFTLALALRPRRWSRT